MPVPRRNPVCRPPACGHLQAGEGGGDPARNHHGAGRRNPFQPAGGRWLLDDAVSADSSAKSIRGLIGNRPAGKPPPWPPAPAVLALGHSARDTLDMLWDRGVFMEAKPFSIGVRIEHPQSVIDRARWGRMPGTRRWAQRLQAGSPCQQRAGGVQLCIMPRRHRGGRHQRARPGGHQRHEPVFAQ